MQSFGNGSRAVVVFKWSKIFNGSTDGHAIIVQCREKDIVNFGDPQMGKRAAKSLLKFADMGEAVILLRIDNLKFTDTVKRCCMNRERVR